MRKPVHRRTVDYSSTVVRYIQVFFLPYRLIRINVTHRAVLLNWGSWFSFVYAARRGETNSVLVASRECEIPVKIFIWKEYWTLFSSFSSTSWAGIFILDRRFRNQQNLERDSLEELSFDNQYLYHKDPAKICWALDLGLQMRTWQRDCGDAPALQPTTAAAVDVSEPWGLGFGPLYIKIASWAGCFILALDFWSS